MPRLHGAADGLALVAAADMHCDGGMARANAPPLLRASAVRPPSMPDVLRIKARVSYTRKVDTGKIAGRTVDEQLWGRLRSAFAVQTISDAQVQTLQDQDDPREISAIDARTLPAPPTIKSHGFELREVPSEITSWQQTPEVDAIGRREAEAIVLVATGADEVYAFDSTWRSSKRNNFDSSLGPGGLAVNMSSSVARVHTDNTPTSGGWKLDELIEAGILPPHARASTHRAAILNVWRAYGAGDRVVAAPLGCVAHDSISAEHTFPYTLAYDGKCGVNGSIAHDEGHQWHYYSAMTPNEVLVFTNYESGETPRQIYHAALELIDPPAPPEAERVSYEVRVVALWRV